jgi:hypothetical protein
MAYVSQDDKKALSPAIKAICKKYKLKASISIRHHSTLVLTISSGPIDFIGNFNKLSKTKQVNGLPFREAKDYIDVNPYWFHEHFDGKALDFLNEVIPAMKGPGWFDKSDIQSDYFHVKHYVDVNVGKWNKPYIYTE